MTSAPKPSKGTCVLKNQRKSQNARAQASAANAKLGKSDKPSTYKEVDGCMLFIVSGFLVNLIL